ncbi:hypothetical protein [Aquipuribacter sp. SD81]|uniref:hypothetical protein n=1 Tax=Aquipuribacter sp. SD81 TaxID=3127703 RepID=UPI00301A6065
MAVRYGEDAVRTVARLLRSTTARVDDLLVPDLPDGMTTRAPAPGGDPARWLWAPRDAVSTRAAPRPVCLGGWGDPASYRLVDDDALRERLLTTPPAGAEALDGPAQQEYLRRSVDLAMKGGATSGVVYPLAVCEIARDHRVRNVGGASAGAIAAAATAAAELGRSSGREGSGSPAPGHLRAGFSGLADLLAWLLQLDGPATGRTDQAGAPAGEEFRLAQLFRPVRSQRHVFDVVVAVMRRRFWALPLAYGWAVGTPARLVVLGLVVLASVVLHTLLGAGTDPGATGPAWWLAPALLGGFVVVVCGLVGGALLGLTWRGQRREQHARQGTEALRRLAEEASSRPAPERARTNGTVALVLLASALALAAAGLVLLDAPTVMATVAVGLALLLLALGALLAGAVRWLLAARGRHYGVVAGATAPGPSSLLSRLVGAPAPTVDRALVPWLSDSLAELAGMPGTVLRFGHLWVGPGFQPVPETADGSPGPGEVRLRELAEQPGRRLVNLEMMTTDLTRGRPFRFPLPVAEPDGGDSGGADALWFDPGDLCAALAGPGRPGTDVLPREVVEAMTALTPRRTVPLADGTGEVVVHRLPHPWNLPVVLAVRISLALPVLFSAVRLYRLLPVGDVRDDLGRTVEDGQGPVPTQAHPCVAEQLWWSDGGITSNFPVHLFDSYLPRWPSFGLDLAVHPPGQPTQDVWLPQDWNVSLTPGGALGAGLPALLGAVLGSARSWRDTLQSALPGFRSRIAAVRQHPSEGGVSLFMPRATVAALALRGALAGARLRERFRDDEQWERHRWLRLRVLAGSLEELRARVRRSDPLYDDLLADGQAGLDRLAAVLPGDPSLPPAEAWYPPVPRFWDHVAGALDGLGTPPPDPGAVAGGPSPEPSLSQVPLV